MLKGFILICGNRIWNQRNEEKLLTLKKSFQHKLPCSFMSIHAFTKTLGYNVRAAAALMRSPAKENSRIKGVDAVAVLMSFRVVIDSFQVRFRSFSLDSIHL